MISLTTFLLTVPKWLQLKIKEEFSAKSNYVLIAPTTDKELKAVEVTDARNPNADTTLLFVTKQLKQPVNDFLPHKTRAHWVKSIILLFWLRSMDSSVTHFLTLCQVLHVHRLPLGLSWHSWPVHKEFKRIKMMLGSVNIVIGQEYA